jgi:hypothetical protein
MRLALREVYLTFTRAPLMAMLGVDCGPVRLPLTQPSAAQLVTVRAQLTEIGFFDFACRPVS